MYSALIEVVILAFSQSETTGLAVVSFTVSFVPASVLGASASIRDPQVIIEVSIKGQEGGSGSGSSEVTNFEKKVVRIVSDFQLAASAVYAGGMLPPQAEKDTSYKVTWTLSNSVNTITNAEARAVLPVYVKWVGPVGGSENITYDAITHEVVWKIGTVKPNTGFGSGDREASFTITLKPSVSQVGTAPQLVKEVILLGTDAFANSPLKSSAPSINTRLDNDPNFVQGNDVVKR